MWNAVSAMYLVIATATAAVLRDTAIPVAVNIPLPLAAETDVGEITPVSSNPSVTVTQGTVVGTLADDGNYAQFYGIPFADSTSGGNRFKAPNPPPTFQDTFIADRKDIKCVRALGSGFEGTEDCLVANIFTPTIDNTAKLPVMVWVKGKEFDRAYENEPSFKNFVEKDVVVVSLNFRENVLGFLCLGTETAPGNAGLKDIIAGLRWVQQNIEQFGGDPNEVTLVGHGSGAAAVDLVTLSPLANGLIQKAISQSGNALSPWAVSRDNMLYAIKVAEGLGHVINDVEELSEIFTRASVPALMGIINELDLTDNSLAFSPCVEREDLEGIEPFFTKSPIDILNAREHLQIPFITGFVDKEGTIRSEEAVVDDWLERMQETFTDFIPADLKFPSKAVQTEVAQSIRNHYFRSDPINIDTVGDYIKYHGDTMILVSTLREVRLRASVSTAPVYLYQFSYKGSLGEPFVGPVKVDSAAHSEELAYLFHDGDDTDIPARDLTIGDILVQRWTSFVKTDLPQSTTSTVFWRPYTPLNSFYLQILNNEEISGQADFDVQLQGPNPDILAFWDEIYEEHFLDAESTWELTDRTEDDDDEDDNTSEEPPAGSTEDPFDVTTEDPSETTTEDQSEITTEDEFDGTTEEPSGEDNSASTAISYTFTIITLFTILSKFHSSQILS